jgi:hypothetical protein
LVTRTALRSKWRTSPSEHFAQEGAGVKTSAVRVKTATHIIRPRTFIPAPDFEKVHPVATPETSYRSLLATYFKPFTARQKRSFSIFGVFVELFQMFYSC